VKIARSELVFPKLRTAMLRHTTEELGQSPYSVVTRTEHSIVSAGTELAMLSGMFPGDARFPVVPKAMITGRVVAIGPAAAQLRPDLCVDDRVLLKGSHASFVETNILLEPVYRLDDSMSTDAALLARQGAVAQYAIEISGVANSENVLIVGLGILGQLIVRYAVDTQARPIIVDRHQNRIQAASSLHSVNTGDCSNTLRKVGATFIACADSSAILDGIKVTKDGGTLVLAAGPHRDVSLDVGLHVFRRNVRIVGAHERYVEGELRTRVEAALQKFSSGAVPTKGLITRRIHFEDLERLYSADLYCKDEYVGLIVNW
jgi:2-desacetyl-2-hydroxyethyl bacteriochlorophyllide A dehydrogenase